MQRKEAIAAGLTKYFTGKPCKHGHIADRYTTTGTCSECLDSARSGVRVAFEPATGQPTPVYSKRVSQETMDALNAWRMGAIGQAIVFTNYPQQTTPKIMEMYAALCFARHPTLPWSTWARPKKITDGGSRLWLQCYLEDEDALRDYGRQLDREIAQAHPRQLGPNLEALRQLDALEEAANPWPTHDPR